MSTLQLEHLSYFPDNTASLSPLLLPASMADLLSANESFPAEPVPVSFCPSFHPNPDNGHQSRCFSVSFRFFRQRNLRPTDFEQVLHPRRHRTLRSTGWLLFSHPRRHKNHRSTDFSVFFRPLLHNSPAPTDFLLFFRIFLHNNHPPSRQSSSFHRNRDNCHPPTDFFSLPRRLPVPDSTSFR